MPIANATAGTVDQVVAELERDGHEVIQLLAAGGSVKVLYRQLHKWEFRYLVGDSESEFFTSTADEESE